MAVTRNFIAQYIASKLGKTGLTVTVNVYRVSDQAQVVTGAAATEIGDGVYLYAWASADEDEEYVATFATADGTVDQQMLMATDWTARIVNDVWDELLIGSTHNISTSAGRRLREVGTNVIREATAQGPGAGTNQIQLDAGASSVDGQYDPALVAIIDGTGAGQVRLILEYNGSMRTATVDRDWKVAPDATSEFQILATIGREHVNEGLVRAATSDTVTLNALASDQDDAYVGQVIFIRSGTGEDQARRITDYDGATQVAIVDRDWDVALDTTSAYVMLPTSVLDFGTLGELAADWVWDELLSSHTTTGSAGKIVADIVSGGCAGAGAITFTYTLTDEDGGDPIADADVWITTDEAGSNVIASGRTDQNGEIVFYVDAGTVYVWRQKSGWDFTNPDTEVVA